MDAGLPRGAPWKCKGGGGLVAAKRSNDRRMRDALGLNGLRRDEDWKVVRLGPTALGVWCPCAPSMRGVGGNRARILDQLSFVGVKCGVHGVIWCLRLRPSVGVVTSGSRTGICACGGSARIEGGGPWPLSGGSCALVGVPCRLRGRGGGGHGEVCFKRFTVKHLHGSGGSGEILFVVQLCRANRDYSAASGTSACPHPPRCSPAHSPFFQCGAEYGANALLLLLC